MATKIMTGVKGKAKNDKYQQNYDAVFGKKSAKKRCCKLDTDGDGNCVRHSAPGVLRKGRV
jgi:hypothetical protein